MSRERDRARAIREIMSALSGVTDRLLRQHRATGRRDLYALGLTLFEAQCRFDVGGPQLAADLIMAGQTIAAIRIERSKAQDVARRRAHLRLIQGGAA